MITFQAVLTQNEFQRHFQNTVKRLRRSFLQKQPAIESPYFRRKTPSFRVMNTPLNTFNEEDVTKGSLPPVKVISSIPKQKKVRGST